MKQSAIAWLALLAVILFTGCQTTPPINWNARIGTYTLDQAIVEFGPPDSQARLADGRLVAKWVHRYDNGGGMIVAGGYHARIIETYPSYYETALILTFAPNNILMTWSQR